MKKIILTLNLLIVLISGAQACEICGCGIGNNYIGILPDFNKSIFGFRYRYNSMLTHVGLGGSSTYLTTAEHYHTTEAWGAFNIRKNLRVMLSVPYGFDERSHQGNRSAKNGIGDISGSVYYQLLNKRQTVPGSRLLVQSLWIGGGVKFASGHYDPLDKGNGSESANLFQLGTGSTDFILSAMYDIRLQDLGLNLNSSYKITTANRYDYRYGNKFSASAQLYYKIRVAEKWTLAPSAGLLTERGRQDMDRGIAVSVSGGQLLMGTTGVETSYKRLAIGGNWQTPFSQQLARGIVRAGNRVMLHVSYML